MTALASSATRFLLPPEAYWSEQWYEREMETVFRSVWHFIGPVSDVPEEGSLLATAGPALTTMWRDGDILEARSVDGERVAVETWLGYAFAHLEPGRATPLHEWLGELPARIRGFRPDQLVEVARRRFEVACNWKLYIENHIDIYHLWYLHEQSLGAYDHPRHEWWDCAPHWAFYEPPRSGVTDEAQFASGFSPISHITSDDWGSGAHLIFPSVPFATGAAFFMTYQCIPRGPLHTTIDLRVRAEGGTTHDAEAFLAMVSTVLHAEDGAACEQIQRAVVSPAFAVGPLASGLEAPIMRFHESLLALMGSC